MKMILFLNLAVSLIGAPAAIVAGNTWTGKISDSMDLAVQTTSDMLAVRIGQLTAEDFHLLRFAALVGCSPNVKAHWRG